MADTFALPAIGDAMVEGEIVEWFVAVGDTIDLDQTICSVETDKSVVELTTPYRGTVLALGGVVGDVIEVGQPLLTVGEPGELVSEPTAPPASQPSVTDSPQPTASVNGWTLSPLVRKLASDKGVDPAAVQGSGVGGKVTRSDIESATAALGSDPSAAVRAMPKVRKAARERGVDLACIKGTGPNGAITLADLEPDASDAGHVDRRVPLTAMRRAIADHMSRSAREIPQFTSMVDVDATALLATRSALGETLGRKVPIDALVAVLMIPVLRSHPIANAFLDGDDIVYRSAVDLGIAVDTQDGLMLPVVKGADRLRVLDMCDEIDRLATAARTRRIHPSDLTGATCTLNNVGAVGIEAGTPILPLGTSTIVALGRTRPVVAIRSGLPAEVPTITINATFDHRIVDGGDAGRFLTSLRQHLEVPALGQLS